MARQGDRQRAFGEGLGLLAQTDAIDARLLARFARQAAPAETPTRSRESRRLANLIRRRRQLVAMIVAEKARRENADRWLRSSIQDLVRLLERRVEKIDAWIDQAIDRDPAYQRLRAAGKPPKLAFVAIARKLLTSINAIVRDEKPWQKARA